MGVREVEVSVLLRTILRFREHHTNVHPQPCQGCGEFLFQRLLCQNSSDIPSSGRPAKDETRTRIGSQRRSIRRDPDEIVPPIVMRLRPRILRRKTIRDTNHNHTIKVCQRASGVAHLEAIAHEKPAAEDENYQRAATGLGRSLRFVDADFALVAIAHGDCAGIFEAARGEG